MGILYKKLIMMGVSTILIPLGKLLLKKIVKKGVDKLDLSTAYDGKDKFVSTTQ